MAIHVAIYSKASCSERRGLFLEGRSIALLPFERHGNAGNKIWFCYLECANIRRSDRIVALFRCALTGSDP